MGGIFINYRRMLDDKPLSHVPVAEALFKKLAQRYGEEDVFLDKRSIQHGAAYPEALRSRLMQADVLLVLIHPTWSTDATPGGTVFLDRPDDWVRHEIETFMTLRDEQVLDGIEDGQLGRKKIFPVMVGGANRDRDFLKATLPTTLAGLSRFQLREIQDTSVGSDITELIKGIDRHVVPTHDKREVPPPPQPQPSVPVRTIAATALAALVLLVGLPAAALLAYGPAEGGPPSWIRSTVGQALLFFFAPLVWVLVTPFLTRRGDSRDRAARRGTVRDNFRTMAPWMVPWVLAIPSLLAAAVGNFGEAVVLLIVAIPIALMIGHYFRRELRREERLPVVLFPFTNGALRRSMYRFTLEIIGWTDDLTRVERDRLDEFRDRLLIVVAQLAERRSWRAMSATWRCMPWRALTYSLVVAATIGGTLADIAPRLAARGFYQNSVIELGLAVVFLAVVTAVLVIATHRHRRWIDKTLDTEVVTTTENLNHRIAIDAESRTVF